MSLSWAPFTATTQIGSVFLSDTADSGGSSIIGSYSSSSIPVDWTGITASQVAGNVYLTIVGTADRYYANESPMTVGTQVGTSGQYRHYILIDPTTNPTIQIRAIVDF